jgi:hypothetical protein
VLIQLPGRHYRYGPLETWDEMFVTYARDCLPRFHGLPAGFGKGYVGEGAKSHVASAALPAEA